MVTKRNSVSKLGDDLDFDMLLVGYNGYPGFIDSFDNVLGHSSCSSIR